MSSPIGYRRVARAVLQKLQPEPLGKEAVVGHPCRWSAGALAPTFEVLRQPHDNERVHLSMGAARVAVAEVVLPAPKRPVHLLSVHKRGQAWPDAPEFAELRREFAEEGSICTLRTPSVLCELCDEIRGRRAHRNLRIGIIYHAEAAERRREIPAARPVPQRNSILCFTLPEMR